MSVVVVGSVNLDLLLEVARLPEPGETVLAQWSTRLPGGKGANQAVALARLGQTTALVACVGSDSTGEELTRQLRDEAVDTCCIGRSQAPTGTAVVCVDSGGENSIVVDSGANSLLGQADIDAAGDLLATSAVTLLSLEVPLAAVTRAAELAGGTVVLNPAPACPLAGKLLQATDVIVPNRGELAALLDTDPPGDLSEIEALARRLEGPGAVVVTMGGDGALVVEAERTTQLSAATVEVVDTTGAGDAFCGALADSLARGMPLVDAAGRGVAVAGLAVARRGAQTSMPRLKELTEAIR